MLARIKAQLAYEWRTQPDTRWIVRAVTVVTVAYALLIPYVVTH